MSFKLKLCVWIVRLGDSLCECVYMMLLRCMRTHERSFIVTVKHFNNLCFFFFLWKYGTPFAVAQTCASYKTPNTRGVLQIIARLIINSMTSFLPNSQLNFFVYWITTKRSMRSCTDMIIQMCWRICVFFSLCAFRFFFRFYRFNASSNYRNDSTESDIWIVFSWLIFFAFISFR